MSVELQDLMVNIVQEGYYTIEVREIDGVKALFYVANPYTVREQATRINIMDLIDNDNAK